MSKSKATRTVQIQKEPTRKQLSRSERDAMQSRRVVIALGGVLLLALLIVFYGILRETVLVLDEPVANVNGETISTRDFQARVRLERTVAKTQILQAQALGDTTTANTYQQELDNPTTLGGQIIQNMVDEILLKQSAKDFGVSVSPEEVQTYIQKQLGYDPHPPTPAPTLTPRPTPTASGPITQTPTPTSTPFPTPTPMSLESFQQTYISQVNQLNDLGFSEQSYRNLIEVRLLADKVRQAIVSTVPTMTEQIQFRYIRIETADFPTVTQSIQQDGFDKVYQAVISNTYPITTVQAADTQSWVPRDVLSNTTEFGPGLTDELFNPQTALSTTISVSSNAAGTAGYVVQVYARGIAPLGSSYLNQSQQQAVEDWLSQRRKPTFLLTWDDRVPTKP